MRRTEGKLRLIGRGLVVERLALVDVLKQSRIEGCGLRETTRGDKTLSIRNFMLESQSFG